MTSCERYQPRMVEALYGELDEERRAEFDAHLCECADCAALFSELRATADLMDRRRRPDPGPEYWDGYWNRLQQRVAREDSVVVDASRFARRRSLGSPRRRLRSKRQLRRRSLHPKCSRAPRHRRPR